ncbi:GIY-YIG nuclease family protein [Achromobacter spanius]|uniref:GIY-YIG nuclease family protein n=1 Tax=Achromobacter spanius TaxID=217203 RepID=UPI0032090719
MCTCHGYLYLLVQRDSGVFKVGISEVPARRLYKHDRQGFDIAEGALYKLPSMQAARHIESLILRSLPNARGKGASHIADGSSECFRLGYLNLVRRILLAALESPLGEGYEECDIDGHVKVRSAMNGWDIPEVRAARRDSPPCRVNGVTYKSFRSAWISLFGDTIPGRQTARIKWKEAGKLEIRGLLFEKI